MIPNWRTHIKNWFKSQIETIPEVELFTIWNSQETQQGLEDVVPRIGVYFEYLNKESENPFPRTVNNRSISTANVDVKIHILIRNFDNIETVQDEVWDLADKINFLIEKQNLPEFFAKKVENINEEQDINHDSLIEFEITYRLLVWDVIEVPDADKYVDVSETAYPNPQCSIST